MTDGNGGSTASADRWAVLLPLLLVTVLGTLSNNVVNLSLRDIAAEFDVAVGNSALTVIAFALMLAILMPLSGWSGDRFGHRRMLLAALVLMVVGHLMAAMAPNMVWLIIARAVQGTACSFIPPLVMILITRALPDNPARNMGAWAAANGLGQALGPPVGGVLNDVTGWRGIFLLLGLITALVLFAVWRTVPSTAGSAVPLDPLGAGLLMLGTASILITATAISQQWLPMPFSLIGFAVGAVLMVVFWVTSRNRPKAFLPLDLVTEPRFYRSLVAVGAQMFTLGTLLVGIPLLLTGQYGLPAWVAGLLFMVLPVTMTGAAPLVGELISKRSPLLVLRLGIIVLALGSGLIALTDVALPQHLAVIIALLVVGGLGIAAIQTPAATGATGSRGGERAVALGVFNMTRFAGSALGAAWVAGTYALGQPWVIYLGPVVLLAGAFLVTFSRFGADPSSAPAR